MPQENAIIVQKLLNDFGTENLFVSVGYAYGEDQCRAMAAWEAVAEYAEKYLSDHDRFVAAMARTLIETTRSLKKGATETGLCFSALQKAIRMAEQIKSAGTGIPS